MSSLEAAVPGGAGSERVVRLNQGLVSNQARSQVDPPEAHGSKAKVRAVAGSHHEAVGGRVLRVGWLVVWVPRWVLVCYW